jgi:hypothetical protein
MEMNEFFDRSRIAKRLLAGLMHFIMSRDIRCTMPTLSGGVSWLNLQSLFCLNYAAIVQAEILRLVLIVES